MKLKGFFIIIYILLTILVFVNFDASYLVKISFFCNVFILFFTIVYHLYYEKVYSPFLSSFIVFSFLFFIAAPISQINSFSDLENSRFVNFFPYKDSLVLYTNVLTSNMKPCFFLVKKAELKSFLR